MKTALLSLSMQNVILRFYLLMAIVIAAGFLGQWWMGLLALPVFLSTLLGVALQKNNKKQVSVSMKAPEQTYGQAA
jgi:cytochrome b561